MNEYLIQLLIGLGMAVGLGFGFNVVAHAFSRLITRHIP